MSLLGKIFDSGIGEIQSLEVLPNVGIGPVKLGMDRAISRKVMNQYYIEYRKTEDSEMTTDAYLENSFQIFFDNNNRVDFIEVSYNPKVISLHYGKINLFETEGQELISILSKESSFLEKDKEIPYGYYFKDYALVLWRPVIPEDYSEGEVDEEYRNGRYFMVIGIGNKGYLFN